MMFAVQRARAVQALMGVALGLTLLLPLASSATDNGTVSNTPAPVGLTPAQQAALTYAEGIAKTPDCVAVAGSTTKFICTEMSFGVKVTALCDTTPPPATTGSNDAAGTVTCHEVAPPAVPADQTTHTGTN